MHMAPYLLPVLSGLAASLSTAEGDELSAMLLKRQAPGTPEYNCHDNCGKTLRSPSPESIPGCFPSNNASPSRRPGRHPDAGK